MVKVRRARLSKTIDTVIHDTLTNQTEWLEDLVVCAGFDGSEHYSGDVSLVQRARINHYGGGKVPSRQFVFAAVSDIQDQDTEYGAEIKTYLKKFVTDSVTYNKGELSQYGTYMIGAKQRYQLLGGGTVEAFMNSVGRAMVRNMKDAILSTNIIGKRENADSTVKRKGKDYPLVDTEEMVNGLHWWASNQHEEAEALGESLTSVRPIGDEYEE